MLKQPLHLLICFILFSPISAIAGMPLETGTVLSSKSYGNWILMVARFNESVQFRIIAPAEDNKNESLIISFESGTCDKYTIDLVTTTSDALQNDIKGGSSFSIDARIDKNPMIEGSIIGSAGNLGENQIHSYINFGNSSTQFLSDLITGNKLRLKIKFDDPAYLRFSLDGSDTSIKMAKDYCEKFTADSNADNDKNFFEDNSNNSTSKKSRGNSKNGDDKFF